MEYNVNEYKFDERTQEQFIKELGLGLKKEVEAINVFKEILRTSVVESPEVVYVGSNEEGEVIYDGSGVANVDIFPDYLLKYKVMRRIRCNLIEVKVCNPHSKYAFFKRRQLEQYNELDNVKILFVMGISTKRPKFILVSPAEILNMGIEPQLIHGKETFKCHVRMFDWEDFAPVERDYSILEKQYIRE